MARPSKRAAPRRRHAGQILAFEQQCSRCYGKTRRQQLRDGAADHGFAGAGFADQAEDLPGRKIER